MSKYFSDFEAGRIAGHYNLQEMELRDNIAFKLAQVLDSALIGQSGQTGNIQLHTGTSATNLNNTAVQEAIRIANSYSIDPSGMAFFMHPNGFWGELLRTNTFHASNIFGKAVISSGEFEPISTLYGIPVYVSGQVGACSGIGTDGYPTTSHRNMLVHKRALVYALGNIDGMGAGPRLQTSRVVAGGYLGTRIIGDIAYGTKFLSGYEGVRIISNT